MVDLWLSLNVLSFKHVSVKTVWIRNSLDSPQHRSKLSVSRSHWSVVCLQSFLVDILLPGWVLSVMKFIYFTIYNLIFIRSIFKLEILFWWISCLHHLFLSSYVSYLWELQDNRIPWVYMSVHQCSIFGFSWS